VLLVVLQPEDEEGPEVGHVFLELPLDPVGHRADRHERLLVHRGVFRVEDLQKQ
jgi:hypothetical protein